MTNITIKTEDTTIDEAATDKKTLTTMLHSDDISLEEKLAAIEAAMQTAQAKANNKATNGSAAAPVDPSLLTMCDSCQ